MVSRTFAKWFLSGSFPVDKDLTEITISLFFNHFRYICPNRSHLSTLYITEALWSPLYDYCLAYTSAAFVLMKAFSLMYAMISHLQEFSTWNLKEPMLSGWRSLSNIRTNLVVVSIGHLIIFFHPTYWSSGVHNKYWLESIKTVP